MPGESAVDGKVTFFAGPTVFRNVRVSGYLANESYLPAGFPLPMIGNYSGIDPGARPGDD